VESLLSYDCFGVTIERSLHFDPVFHLIAVSMTDGNSQCIGSIIGRWDMIQNQ